MYAVFETTLYKQQSQVPFLLMDISKMHELGWKHQVQLEEGIQLTYDWFLENANDFKEVKM